MKKFMFVLLVLLILCGTVFFLGWAQLTIPPGSYGVMQSKTHGLDSQVIRGGEFRWIWYKLIPTNVKISSFSISPVKRYIKSSGNLSSGQVYAELAGLEADFSWEISGEFSFNIKPDYLPELIAKENISDDEGLRRAEENLAAKVENLVLERLKAYANDDDGDKMDADIYSASLPEMSHEIQVLMPEIENLNCTMQVLHLPDYALYQSLRALSREYIARQSSALSIDITQEADRRVNSKIRIEELSQYGELLTKYPILLDFLAVEKGLNDD